MIENQQKVLVQVIGTNGVIRNSDLEKQLKIQKIEFKVVDGIFPSKKEFEAGVLHSKLISSLICQRTIRIGEVGCALAHKKTANNLINSPFEYSIVLEDDADLVDSVDFEIIVNILNSSEPRILILGWIPGFAVAYESTANNDKFFELATPSTCTFAYALNQSAAKLLIDENKKIIDLADWPIYLFNKVRFLILNSPWFDASHDPENSTIGARISNIPENRFEVYFFRLRLIISTIILFILHKFINSKITNRQIFHRMILKDKIYGFGLRSVGVRENSSSYKNLVFISDNFRKFTSIK